MSSELVESLRLRFKNALEYDQIRSCNDVEKVLSDFEYCITNIHTEDNPAIRGILLYLRHLLGTKSTNIHQITLFLALFVYDYELFYNNCVKQKLTYRRLKNLLSSESFTGRISAEVYYYMGTTLQLTLSKRARLW